MKQTSQVDLIITCYELFSIFKYNICMRYMSFKKTPKHFKLCLKENWFFTRLNAPSAGVKPNSCEVQCDL